MNTAQLECFICLASTLNYVKAADQLCMTQPAVSKQIQSLEKELGAQLFIRTTRSVSLTEIGALFLPEATSIMGTYYHSKKWISKYHAQFSHSLKIGYSDPHCINLISYGLEKTQGAYPNMAPELKYNQTDSNLSQLIAGHLDLVVSMRDQAFSDDNIIFKKIHEERFRCLLSVSHPLAVRLAEEKRAYVHSEDIWPYRQVINIPPYLLKNFFSRGRRIVPVNDELDNLVCANTNEAYGLVLAGFGYCLVPVHLIMEHPRLISYTWEESPHAPLGVYYRKDIPEGEKRVARFFMEQLKSFPAFLEDPHFVSDSEGEGEDEQNGHPINESAE